MMYRHRYAMVFLTVLLLGSLIFAICEFLKVKKAADDLAHVNMFAVGFVGFIPHLSEEEMLYRNVLNSRYSRMFLLQIGNSDKSSLEAKIFAACGLYAISSVDFYNLSATLKGKKHEVSVLRADILRKETVDDLLNEIVSGNCKAW